MKTGASEGRCHYAEFTMIKAMATTLRGASFLKNRGVIRYAAHGILLLIFVPVLKLNSIETAKVKNGGYNFFYEL